MNKTTSLSDDLTNDVIGMAWCDKTSFESIAFFTGLNEKDVVKVMRSNLKRSSFKLWRKRVKQKKQKHGFKFKSRD